MHEVLQDVYLSCVRVKVDTILSEAEQMPELFASVRSDGEPRFQSPPHPQSGRALVLDSCR